MYGMNYSGGDNKTHGQIERAWRIDSFDTAISEGSGTLFARMGEKVHLLDFDHFTEYGSTPETDREFVELWGVQTLELSRTPSGFGGSCAFWLCPRCGKRARFLYFKGRGFVCRGCARLNYRCQQRTKDSINHVRDGLKLARERLGWVPPFEICPAEFPYVTPDRPKGMHETTYHRYLARYRRYQEKYQRESMREMLAILRPFK